MLHDHALAVCNAYIEHPSGALSFRPGTCLAAAQRSRRHRCLAHCCRWWAANRMRSCVTHITLPAACRNSSHGPALPLCCESELQRASIHFTPESLAHEVVHRALRWNSVPCQHTHTHILFHPRDRHTQLCAVCAMQGLADEWIRLVATKREPRLASLTCGQRSE